MRRGVIGGGNFIVDYVRTIDHYPLEQTLANIEGEYVGSGGAPYNVLLGLAKLGADFPLHAVGRIGDDEAGHIILDDCRANGIDVSRIAVTEDVPTSYTLVMVAKETGRRTFFHQRGANAKLSPEDFDFDGFAGSHFHYGYLLLLDQMDAPDAEYGTSAARVLARAKQAGLTTSIDLVSEDSNRFMGIVPPALKYTDLAFMNEFEASRLTGLDLERVSAEKVAEARSLLGFEGVLIVHSQDGSAAAWADGQRVFQGSVLVPTGRIASVTGAGDAFVSGYLLAHLEGSAPPECLQMGACAAAASIMSFTCTDGILPRAGCLELGAKYGFRS